MSTSLLQLDIIHTGIATLALLIAGIALCKEGFIKPYHTLGKGYSVLTAIGCIGSFGLSESKRFTSLGYVIFILILGLLSIAYYLGENVLAKSKAIYLQTFCMSTTVFLLLIPTAYEILSRLPVGQPIVDSPDSPIIQSLIKVSFVFLITGLIIQGLKLNKVS